MMIRLSFILYVPRLVLRLASVQQDRNVLHDGRRQLSGRKLAATSTDILFKDVKAAA